MGTSVTISGQNFSTTAGENTVTFLGAEGDDADNAAATVSAATTTSLTVTVPAAAKTIMRVCDGAAVISSQTFTVTTGDARAFATPEAKTHARMYPNPTSGQIRFVNLSAVDNYTYKLYSLVGMRGRLLRLKQRHMRVCILTLLRDRFDL